MKNRLILLSALIITVVIATSLYYRSDNETLTIYSGRSEELISPIIDRFEEEYDIEVVIKYGDSVELANLINTEGKDSPADLFIAQDVLSINRVEQELNLLELSNEIKSLSRSNEIKDNNWLGVTSRLRTVVYDSNNYYEEDLSSDITEYCKEKYKEKVGWAPQNASFQTFLGELVAVEGEEFVDNWLKCMIENETKIYPKNTPIVQAIVDNEIQLGFVNHYYLERFLAEDSSITATNFFPEGVLGMSNMSTIGIIDHTDQQEVAEDFVRFIMNEESQNYFLEETHEVPVSTVVELSSEYQLLDLEAGDEELEKALELLSNNELL